MKHALRGFGLLLVIPCVTAVSARDGVDSYIATLNDVGNVNFETGISGDGLDAKTRFDLSVQVNWSYELSLGRNAQRPEVAITVQVKQIDEKLQHFIRLPAQADRNSTWFNELLLHEYDHVAISSDERPRILLRSLLNRIGRIERPWTGGAPNPSGVNAMIRQEVDARKSAVVKLMQHAYQKLDQACGHGREALPNRKAFFSQLYSIEHLREAKFPYLAEAEKVTAEPAFQNAKRYYR